MRDASVRGPEPWRAPVYVAARRRTRVVKRALGAQYGVELPIATQMAEVLSGRADVRTALDALMLRKQRAEAEAGPVGDGVTG